MISFPYHQILIRGLRQSGFSIGNLSSSLSPESQIRLKAIASLNLLVTKVLELDLVGGLMLQSNLPDVLAGRGKPGHGFQKNRCFFLTDLELATYCFNEGCHAITDHIIT